MAAACGCRAHPQLFLTRWFPDSSAGRALALFSTAASTGGLLSSAGSGLLMTALDGVGGVRGWRWLLLLQGLPTILLGLLVPCSLDEAPEQARWLTEDERHTLLSAIEAAHERGRAGGKSEMLASPSTDTLVVAAADAPQAVMLRARALRGTPSEGGRDTGEARDAPPLTMCDAVCATVGGTHCLLFAAQYLISSALTNSARFFLPQLLKGVFPALSAYKIGLAFTLPATLKVVLAPLIAQWADAGGRPRRLRAAWGMYGSGAALLLVAGAGMMFLLLSGSGGSGGGGGGGGAGAHRTPHDAPPHAAPAHVGLSTVLVALVALADVLCQLAIPVFWSLHNASTARPLQGCSIAIVNSIGNLGGFAGPYVLGALHDVAVVRPPRASSVCGSAGRACTALPPWGYGATALGAIALLVTVATAHAITVRVLALRAPRILPCCEHEPVLAVGKGGRAVGVADEMGFSTPTATPTKDQDVRS